MQAVTIALENLCCMVPPLSHAEYGVPHTQVV